MAEYAEYGNFEGREGGPYLDELDMLRREKVRAIGENREALYVKEWMDLCDGVGEVTAATYEGPYPRTATELAEELGLVEKEEEKEKEEEVIPVAEVSSPFKAKK